MPCLRREGSTSSGPSQGAPRTSLTWRGSTTPATLNTADARTASITTLACPPAPTTTMRFIDAPDQIGAETYERPCEPSCQVFCAPSVLFCAASSVVAQVQPL